MYVVTTVIVCVRVCVCACVSLMMLFCQRREETPVTIVMRGIYISYLAVNHSDLLPSCLIPTRQVCVCQCVCVSVIVLICICKYEHIWG